MYKLASSEIFLLFLDESSRRLVGNRENYVEMQKIQKNYWNFMLAKSACDGVGAGVINYHS